MLKENQNTEFKRNWGDEYLQYVSGFANAQGGTSVHIQRKVEKTLPEVDTFDITDRQKQMISILAKNPGIGLVELSNYLSLSRRTIATEMSILKKKGILQRKGSDKKGYWEIVGFQ